MQVHHNWTRRRRTRLLMLMSVLAMGLASSVGAQQSGLRFEQSGFAATQEAPAGWEAWSQREATAPRIFVSTEHSLGEAGSLAISGDGNAAAHGGWHRRVDGIVPGRWYRLRASYRTEAIVAPNWQVVARVDWSDANGGRRDQPDYASWTQQAGEWTQIEGTFQAPAASTSAVLQFHLLHAAEGKVWWDAITFEEIAAPQPRLVTVASVNLRPRGTETKEASLAAFAETVRGNVPPGVDLIVLPEGITVVGTKQTYLDVAERVPGADTAFLATLAREKKAYLAAGIYERDGDVVYNTSVLLDREGRLVGKYRKVYLPREELEGGITPGDSYPVFETDFGRVGMMICYDVFFPDPARALAAQGADIILMPIWGGPERLAVARALENRVYLAASGYDHPTYVMDPNGDVLASADDEGSIALTTIDLSKRHREAWLGEMRTRRLQEIRTDIPLPMPGRLDRAPETIR
jgi:predicted amidohydrolase